MSTNPKSIYNEFIRANLPVGITYDEARAQYVTGNGKRFPTYLQAKWYLDYIVKFGYVPSEYTANGIHPVGVLDFARGFYSDVDGRTQTSSDIVTYGIPGLATMLDSDGLRKWRAHNIATHSEDASSWVLSETTATTNTLVAPDGSNTGDVLSQASGFSFADLRNSATNATGTYTVSIYLKFQDIQWIIIQSDNAGAFVRGWFDVQNGVVGTTTTNNGGTVVSHTIAAAENGWYICTLEFINGALSNQIKVFGTSGDGSTVRLAGDYGVWGVHLYRSDLGGMASVPVGQRIAGSETYVPTTSSAVYLPRENSYLYDASTSSWVNNGLFLESEARTQLLHTTDTLVTQSHTVTAVPHTLHFTGTGTVTLSGASTAGPLVGTGAGNQNRVSLTFTPTAASLTLTVSGTVSDAQLEVGSTPSSYIPNIAASGISTRAAETMVIEPANNPLLVGGSMPTAISIGMKGTMTGANSTFINWTADADNGLLVQSGASDLTFTQEDATVVDTVTGGTYTSGINVPFNIASRHGATFINGAVDGTALTANLTPTALPDLTTADFQIAPTFMGHIQELPLYADNVADTGLEELTSL